MMQSSLCFALLATAAALQAPTTRTQQRRGVVARAPMDLNVLEDEYCTVRCRRRRLRGARRLNSTPDADGAGGVRYSVSGHGGTDAGYERARRRSVVPRRSSRISSQSFFPTGRVTFDFAQVERLEERHIHRQRGHRALLPLFFFVVRP